MVEKFNMTRNQLIAKLNAVEDQNADLLEALRDLLDGLDSNYDERLGLTNDQWEQRIKYARQAIAKVQIPPPGGAEGGSDG